MIFKRLIWLGWICCLSLNTWAMDLWLKPEVHTPKGFVRLSQLIEDTHKIDIYHDVWLGKAPEEKPQHMSLDYISERLRKKGFLTVRPKLRNRKDHVVLTPFIATSQSTPHATARLHQEDTLKPDVESLSASENTKSAQHYYCALKMALPRGTLLEPDMVELTLEKRFIEDAFISPEDLIGYRLERSLSKGSILSKRHVTIPPAIEKGATVKIVMRSPGIEITGIAKTLGQGKVGDTIEVRRNRETLQGTIVDPHTVLIQ